MRYKVIRAIKSTNPTISCLNTLQDDMELTSRNLLISGATNRNTSPGIVDNEAVGWSRV